MTDDILNDDTSHFKLARSVSKIASYEFANRQYFNSTLMNLEIVRLVLNEKCELRNSRSSSVHVSDCFDSDKTDKQNILYLVACIYMLKSNEISKIEKIYL